MQSPEMMQPPESERWITIGLTSLINLGLVFWICAESHVLWQRDAHPLKACLVALHCIDFITLSVLPYFDRAPPPSEKKRFVFAGIAGGGLTMGLVAFSINIPAFMYGVTALAGMFSIPYLFVEAVRMPPVIVVEQE
jgi:hypothetical protein